MITDIYTFMFTITTEKQNGAVSQSADTLNQLVIYLNRTLICWFVGIIICLPHTDPGSKQ